jgi:quinoprotein glucose dehydrogenase
MNLKLIFISFIFSLTLNAQDQREPVAEDKIVPSIPVPIPGVSIPEGTELKVVANFKNQGVRSPVSLCFDEKSRLFVAETNRFKFGVEDNRERLFWYLDDLASQKVEDRKKLHEKWDSMVPVKSLTEKSETIRLLEDENGDGIYEKSKIFSDGYSDLLDGTAGGVFALEGKVYFACIPKIWALRDQNSDGVSDSKEVIQDGFGVKISLSGHDLNGFAFGTDGMIWGTVGDRGLSFKSNSGKEYHYPNEGVVFRFDPDGSNFEIVHTGLRNPKEIAFDDLGNPVSVDNNSDQGDKARIVYIVPGGDSGWQMEHQTMFTFYRQIGLTDFPINRWMAERMWESQNDDQPSYMLPPVAHITNGPCGLTYYPGTGFLESEKNRFLIVDYVGASTGSGVHSFSLAENGAGMNMVDSRRLLLGAGVTDVEYSWDGKLFISDYNGDGVAWIAHDDGRILCLDAGKNTYKAEEAKNVSKLVVEGFDQRSTLELGSLLKHSDLRVRLRAQISLTRRADGLEALKFAMKSDDKFERLHGIWGLGILARRGMQLPSAGDSFMAVPDIQTMKAASSALIQMLNHEDAEVRAQTLKVLADAKYLVSTDIPLMSMLSDKSDRVKFFAALLVGKTKSDYLLPKVMEMIANNNNKDAYLRHAGAFAIASVSNEQQIDAFIFEKKASVRLAAVVGMRRLKSDALAAFVNDPDQRVADEAIRAIHDQMIEKSRPYVAALLDQRAGVKRTEMMWRRLLHSAFRCGGEENIKRLVSVACDSGLSESIRKEAMRLLSTWVKPFPVDQSIGHWSPLPERDPKILLSILNNKFSEMIVSGSVVMSEVINLAKQYDIKPKNFSDEDWKKIVDNNSMPANARASALSLISSLSEEDLSRWSESNDDQFSIAVLDEAAKRNSANLLSVIKKSIVSTSVKRQQKAWSLLGGISGVESAEILWNGMKELVEKKGELPYAIELLESAKIRSEDPIKESLKSLDLFTNGSDPVAAWSISLLGGDAERGAKIFQSHPAECMRCHKAGGGHQAGGDAGPNLGGVATRGNRSYLLESIINPSAKVASGYGVIAVTLKNSAIVSGVLLAETSDHIDIADGEKAWRVSKSDVQEKTPPISSMPPMGSLLKPYEARDLVAWLRTLKKSSGETKAQKNIEPYLMK